ncbi:SRPBCC family protein [Capnocytophaga sp.]|uniref:SRPBCC family protein n=1 Tax=Capnocytophaga sp. TaxID=44737 RepID=UPI0026DC54DA|nr:SRPBCC family protein [Capnocytophaga sp.]MDO5106096.1 SRPBCC family protein [Capnocytophaga sp.]
MTKKEENARLKIEINTLINKSIATVWAAYTEPKHITHWNFATPEWHCPKAENDLRVGGAYFARMEARDGSFGFDFKAIYKEVSPEKSFVYTLEDGREVQVIFENQDGKTQMYITFDAENQHSAEMQQAGWQSILNNFKAYTENLTD